MFLILNPLFAFALGSLYFVILPALFSSTISLFELILITLYLITFIIGYNIKLKWRPLPIDNNNENSIIFKFAYRNIFKFLFIYLAWSFYSYQQKSNYVDNFTYESDFLLYFQIVERIFLIFGIIIVSHYASISKKKFIAISITCILLSSLSSTRLDLIFTLIFFIGFGLYFKHVKIHIIYFILLTPLLPLIFSFLLIRRSIESFEGNFINLQINTWNYMFENVDELKNIVIMSMESFGTYEIFQKVITDNIIAPMSGYLRIIFMPIPRSIWDEKPDSVSRLLVKLYFPDSYEKGGGMIAGPIGDAYINGGIIGVVLIWLALGIIMRFSYNNILLRNSNGTNKIKSYLFYFTFYHYFIVSLRGFSSDFFWAFLSNIFFISAVYYIFEKRNKVIFRCRHPNI